MSTETPPAALSMSDKKFEGISLSRERTIQWVGNICLQKSGESVQAKGVPQSVFLAQWHDLLPEGWRWHASMDLLKAYFLFIFSLSQSNKDAG